MRIGTWNLDGRWSPRHAGLLADQACDVWLLTEVPVQASFPGYDVHLGAAEMVPGRSWAGIISRAPLTPLPDPHPAGAMATTNGLTVISTVLPWKGAGATWPWAGTNTAERTAATLALLLPELPRTDLVWGGDWNHALDGPSTPAPSRVVRPSWTRWPRSTCRCPRATYPQPAVGFRSTTSR